MQYDTLQESDESLQPLREWFAEVTLQAAEATVDFPGRHHVHDEPLSVMRPVPPVEVCSRPQAGC